MRTTQLFFKTFKEAPHEADIISHQLLERGGYLNKLGKGLYIYSPLMCRVLKKIMTIVRDELDRTGAQEISAPTLHPAELWKASGRWDGYIAENLLYTIRDREDHEYCLAPTHEEIVVSFVSQWVSSYKQLPLNLYQIGDKFRDEIRPRFGLIRGKEFLMKDGYSFSTTPEGMEKEYQVMRQAYSRIFERLGLDFAIVEAHGGKIGKGKSEEFQVKAEIGEDAIMVCGEYAANVEATVATPPPYTYDSSLKEKKKVDTPHLTTIDVLAPFLKIDPQQILKTLVYKLIYADRKEFVAIGIRGDRQVNEVKVLTRFGASEIALASDEEVKKATGSQVGFIGPLDSKLPFYADQSCEPMTNFVCAANVVDIHYLNVNWERDLPKPEFDDFLLAEEGDLCPQIPGGAYKIQRGIEVGHIFNLGTRYTELLGANFQDEIGHSKPIWMGTYGIGIGRTAAACIEQMHDERGIIWPLIIAPFKILITAANMKDAAQVSEAEVLYGALQNLGCEPLLDDRNERLGFKLRDSDLIGIPYKLIVGKGFVESGKVEIEPRVGEKIEILSLDVHKWAEDNLMQVGARVPRRPLGSETGQPAA